MALNMRNNHQHGVEGNPASIKVVMYHQIVSDEDTAPPMWYRLPVGKFHEHLEWLDRRGFTTITFEDYRLFRQGILNLPRRPVILTFDDGYYDNYKYAFPLLKQFGMRAVMFVLGNRKITQNTWDRDPVLSGERLMTDHEIIEMHQAGFEIGAHSYSHARLTDLPRVAAWEEIYYSRMRLEALLNSPVNSFAYPFGILNREIKGMVVDAGYTHACSVFSGPATFDSDSFEIRRMTITNSTGRAGLGVRLLLPYPHYQWTRWKVGGLLKVARAKFQPSLLLPGTRQDVRVVEHEQQGTVGEGIPSMKTFPQSQESAGS